MGDDDLAPEGTQAPKSGLSELLQARDATLKAGILQMLHERMPEGPPGDPSLVEAIFDHANRKWELSVRAPNRSLDEGPLSWPNDPEAELGANQLSGASGQSAKPNQSKHAGVPANNSVADAERLARTNRTPNESGESAKSLNRVRGVPVDETSSGARGESPVWPYPTGSSSEPPGSATATAQLKSETPDGETALGAQGSTVEPASGLTGSDSTSARLAEDGPACIDLLGFADYARAIAGFLTHQDSKPPLTISIQAPWGGGKTSLMLMIEKELDPDKHHAGGVSDSNPTRTSAVQSNRVGAAFVRGWNALRRWLGDSESSPNDVGQGLTVAEVEAELEDKLAREGEPGLPSIPRYTLGRHRRVTIWFNAWKYESTNQVWAGLVDAILQQVPSRLPRKEQERFWFRLNLSRVGAAKVRQRLHEHFIELAFRTSIGLARGLAVSLSTAAVFLVLYILSSTASFLHSLFGWAIPMSAIAAFGLIKVTAAKVKLDAEPVSQVVKNLVEVPKYEQEVGFVHQVEKDLARVFKSLPLNEGLVIFIDDLDRCSPSKVASVLEAVNLFLAGGFSNCCFVVGMDTEMVAAALQTAHKDLVANLPADARIPIGWRFMDKFVQLPFVIPPLDSKRYRSFMMQLLGKNISDTTLSPSSVTPNTLGRSVNERNLADSRAQEGFDEEAEQFGALRTDTDEFVNLTVEAASIFRGNPRELKRFINLLRFNYFLWFSRTRRELPVPPKRALSLWTALSVKWPDHVRWLRRVELRQLSDMTLRNVFDSVPSRFVASPTAATNHLAILEVLASNCSGGKDVKQWRDKLMALYGVDKTVSWLTDESLLDFYFQLGAKSDAERSLSQYVGTGFW